MTTLSGNISCLSDAEKFDLLDAWWEAIEGQPASVSAEQAEELDRRIWAYEKDPSAVTSWDVLSSIPR